MFIVGAGLLCALQPVYGDDSEPMQADEAALLLHEWSEADAIISADAAIGPPESDSLNEQIQPAVTDSTLKIAAQVEALDSLDETELDLSAGPPIELAIRLDPCKQFDGTQTHWLDQQQVFVYRTVCGATAWFDGFFGNRRYDQDTGNTFGRITVGGYWDQLNGWDQTLRFRANFALPAVRKRGSITIGRGDEEDLIEERDDPATRPVATNPTDNDVSTFVGFNFDKLRRLSKALGLNVGVKLRVPPEPYVKLKYLRVWQLSERNLIRLRPVVYWRSEEGYGSTLSVDFDRVLSNSVLFRWSNYGNVSQDEEVEGVNWGSTFYLFQALSNKRAVTYSIFARGETKAEVPFQNVGFEVRYRKQVFRDWLFMETGGGVSWPRYELDDVREANFGIGLRFEAYFGPAPEDWMLQRF